MSGKNPLFQSGKSGSGGIFAGAGFGKSAGFRPEPKSSTVLVSHDELYVSLTINLYHLSMSGPTS